MRVGFVDSGLGVIPTALALSKLVDSTEFILSMDPDKMPWGPLDDAEVAQRAVFCAQAAVDHGAEAIVLACNTASVLALDEVRGRFEPAVPVIGTVPAIKPAAARGGPFAVWATKGTTGSAYQARLIADFAAGVEVAQIACPGLAEAVESGDVVEVDRCVQLAINETPSSCRAIVLGCTQYPVVVDRIQEAVGDDRQVMDSSLAVARQTMSRLGIPEAVPNIDPWPNAIKVLLSGVDGPMPERALGYAATQALLAACTRSAR